MIIISIVEQKMIPLIWPMVEPMIELACGKSNGELTVDQIVDKLLSKEMALATVSKGKVLVAALTFEQREFDSGKRILHVATAGGELASEWIDEVDDLCDQLAKKYDCSEIYIIGRAGWVRKLKHLDYKVVHTVISRKVGE